MDSLLLYSRGRGWMGQVRAGLKKNNLVMRCRFWHNYSCTHPAQNFKHKLR
jgi:hypothetical protein